MKLILLAAFTGLLFTSCGKKEPETPLEQPKEVKARTVSPLLVSPNIDQESTEQPLEVKKPEKSLVDANLDIDAAATKCSAKLALIDSGVKMHQRIYNLKVGDSFDPKSLKELITEPLTCPLDNTPYTFAETIPSEGSPYAICPHGHTQPHSSQ